MKATGLIFFGLCLIPCGILISSIWLFFGGSASLLAGNIKLMKAMRLESMPHQGSSKYVGQ